MVGTTAAQMMNAMYTVAALSADRVMANTRPAPSTLDPTSNLVLDAPADRLPVKGPKQRNGTNRLSERVTIPVRRDWTR